MKLSPDIGILGATVAAVVTGPLLSGPEFGCADAQSYDDVCALCAVTTFGPTNRRNLELLL